MRLLLSLVAFLKPAVLVIGVLDLSLGSLGMALGRGSTGEGFFLGSTGLRGGFRRHVDAAFWLPAIFDKFTHDLFLGE